MLFGLAELLDLEVPTILHLIRRNQEMMDKEYVAQLPDGKVRFCVSFDFIWRRKEGRRGSRSRSRRQWCREEATLEKNRFEGQRDPLSHIYIFVCAWCAAHLLSCLPCAGEPVVRP